MTDWNTCPAVERNPRKISGAWAFEEVRPGELREVPIPRHRVR